MISRALGFGTLVSIAVVIALSEAQRAEACVYQAPPPALVGYPEDGALGVPTDVLPIYDEYRVSLALMASVVAGSDGSLDVQASSFELVDDTGTVTSLATGVGGGVWFAELVPTAELEPLTHYTLRTIADQSVDGGLELSFTTGDGPLATPPEPPVASIEHYSLTSDEPSSCSPWPTGTCISIADSSPGVYVEEVGFEAGTSFRSSYGYLFNSSRFTDIAGIDQGTPYDCVELRTRAPNGVFSEPVTLCREDAELRDIRGSEDIACTAEGITQDDVLVSALPPAAAATSCSLPAGGGASRVSALLWALSLLLPLRLRRRVIP